MKVTLMTILAAFCLSFGAGAVEFHGGYDFEGLYNKSKYKYIVTTSGYNVDDSLLMEVDFEYYNMGEPKLPGGESTPLFKLSIQSTKHRITLYEGMYKFACFQSDLYDYLNVECVSEIRIPFSGARFEASIIENKLKNPKEKYTKKVPWVSVDCFETIKGGTCD